jgi:DNA-directed RNA polymerase specialized sigma subunit
VEVIDEVQIPAEVESDLERLVSRRREAEALRRDVATDTRRATRALRRVGLSTRDVGEILGVSAARVTQIERETSP